MAETRVITLGCRLNAFESEVMRRHARAAGLEDTVIVNTCTVTAEAGRQARQTVRRLRRRHPHARIVVTGCAAQIDPETFAAMPEVDQVLGNTEKMDPAAWRPQAGAITNGTADDIGGAERLRVADIMVRDGAGREPLEGFSIGGLEGRTRAFTQVQQGCDHRCTFCIVPFARGPSRSLPADTVVDQVRHLAGNGHAEVVLTGVDISSFGTDLADRPTLGGLVRRILAEVPELRRLRLSTVDPGNVDRDLLMAFAEEPRLMPHLHLSLQSADDIVLKRMRRRHDRADALVLCNAARRARPDVVFGADLIAGFPTESDAMFKNTLAAINDLGLTYLHVFPYSPRPNTPAARMPPVPKALRTERAARLRAAGAAALARSLASRVGSTAEVLVEEENRGRSRTYAPVSLTFDALPGAVVETRITEAASDHLIGTKAT